MVNPSFISLVQNVALLLAMALLFDQAPLRWRNYTVGWWQVPFGLILGGIGILLMLTPWVFTPGIIFDTRSVLLSITGLFFGIVPASVAVMMCIVFRLYQGGLAAQAGIYVILMSGTTGVAWRYLRKRPLEAISKRELFVFGLAIHVVMLAIMLTLPWPTALEVLSAISLPVLTIYPLGTILLGALMVDRLKREQANQELLLRESRLRSIVDILQHRAQTTPELLEYCLNQAVQLTGSRFGFISIDPEWGEGENLNIWSTSVKQECELFDKPNWEDMSGIRGEVFRTLKPVIVNNFNAPNPLKKGSPQGHVRVLKYMSIPVFNQGHIVAVAGMANKDSDYDESDALQVTLLMDAVWKAVQWKKTEEALQHSEANYRLLYEQASDGIFILDETGKFIDVNLNGCAMLGYSREHILSINLLELIDEKDLELVPLQIDRLLAGEHVLIERRAKHLDGSRVDLEINACLLPGGRLLGVARNISARKRAEAQVQKTQAELTRLLDASDQSRRALLSIVEDQVLAQEHISRLNAELEQRVRDRTAQLQVVNEELESFAHSVSHDLRAPLRAMDGFSSALISDYPQNLDEQGLHFLGRIQEASRQMGSLIEDLLSLSRVTRSDLTRERVDLSAMAEAIASEYRVSDPARQVAFAVQPGLIVQADSRLMKIAMDNLIGNAFKFTGNRDDASIRIGMLEGERQRVYYVRDNGAGFDMAYAAKLFAPFQRLHSVKEFPGTGIGLVTVQRIVHRHGGRIWTEAEVDRGASFYFTLENLS
jgi:PAS domain S-box-containing protein